MLRGTRVELEDYAALARKAAGYPVRGVHVGGGRHVEMPETWNGQGASPPGWTAEHTVPVPDASKGDYVCEEYEGDTSRLTAAERARWAALNARKEATTRGVSR